MLRQIWLYGRILVGVAFGVGVAYFIVRGVDWPELLNQLSQFNWVLMAPVFGVVVASNAVRAYRWHMLFHREAPRPTFLFFVENTGQGLNNLAPIRVVAEPIQFGYVSLREGYDRGVVLASIILGRMTDLVVTLGSLAIGFAIFRAEGAAYLRWVILPLIGLVLIVAAISLYTHKITFFDRFPIFRTYSAAWQDLVGQPRRLISVLAVTLTQWLILGFAAFIVAVDQGIRLAGYTNDWQLFGVIYVVVIGTMTLGAVLPGLPSGIGPFEAAAVAFLGFYGVPKESALAFGLIIHMGLFIPPIVIAIGTLIIFGPPWSTRHRMRRLRRERRAARQAAAARSAAQEEEI